jgi:D-xylono/L-arabinono-1,4-lactonase
MDERRLCGEPEVVADCACAVGENPLWNVTERKLFWTDITAGFLYHYDPTEGTHARFYTGRPVGGFTHQQDGSLLLFKDRGTITLWNGPDEITVVSEIPAERELRFNDVIADPIGRIFCGTYTQGRKGRLYRLDTEGTLTMILDEIGCSNGMAFTLDRSGFFYTDSFAHSIYRFDFDESTGDILHKTIFYSVPEGHGFPDGCTVDSQDHLWFALWGGAVIVRLDPKGRVAATIPMPAQNITSLTFGGEDLKDIYVTSEGGISRTDSDPRAGALFRIRSRISGRPEFCSRVSMTDKRVGATASRATVCQRKEMNNGCFKRKGCHRLP